MTKSLPKTLEWKESEHHHDIKSEDWFWTLGIVVIAGTILAIYFRNIILGILIVIAGMAIMLHGHSKPKVITFKISRKGIQAGDIAYPYSSLESFWVIDEDIDDKIILKSQKFMMPYIIIPFDSTKTDPDVIRDMLLQHIDEEEMEEPLFQRIIERIFF
jgi:hypothetical protein